MATGDNRTNDNHHRQPCSPFNQPRHPVQSDQSNDDICSQVQHGSQQLQILESSINTKLTELHILLQQHDRNMKQMLKSHQNSVKQSVKAQLEKSQMDQRRYMDDALKNQETILRGLFDERRMGSSIDALQSQV